MKDWRWLARGEPVGFFARWDEVFRGASVCRTEARWRSVAESASTWRIGLEMAQARYGTSWPCGPARKACGARRHLLQYRLVYLSASTEPKNQYQMDRVDYEPLIVQDIVNWNQHDELNLSPWYQRRSVWTQPQKAYLLNTLFEQKPMPTLYFRHTLDLELDKSVREVVDGQQRIRAILEYIDNKFSALHPGHGKKVKYEALSSNEKRHFRETKLSGGWLLGATDPDVIEVFGRLNSVAKTLNQQERRNAEYSGELKQFCLREAASRVALWRDLKIFSANDIARMQEMEFISDVVLNLKEGLTDSSPRRLNGFYKDNDETFRDAAKLKSRLDSCLSRVADLPAATIRDTVFSRKPVFFSLLLTLDTLPQAKGKKLQEALQEIDKRFNSDKPLIERPKPDADFFVACRASTTRIASRRVRDKYLKRFIR